MKEREARAKAEQTTELGGTPIRTLGSAASFVVFLIAGVFAIVASMLMARLALGYLFALVTIAGLVVWYLRALGAVRANNEGVGALLRGHDELATQRFRALVKSRSTRENVAMGLHNLGVVALRAGRSAAAIDVFRAALAVSAGAFRFRRTADGVSALVRAHLGLVLAATGDLDGAEHELALATRGQRSRLPMTLAYVARAQAYVALKRDRPAEAVALLDDERALLANVLTGNESMLAEAMLAVALERLGGVYANGPRPPSTVWVDEAAARFIFAFLPEAKDHLAQEELT
ncbi:hypothetical protein BH09MYX1_BH09MYX1_63970 [soil metagenome]